MIYLFLFFLSFICCLVLTMAVRRFAVRFHIIDVPGTVSRKTHIKPTPLLGGLAIFTSFFAMLFILTWFTDLPQGRFIETRQLVGVFIGALFLMIGGFLDDKYNLKPRFQIIWPILAALAVVFSGVQVERLTNPFGGVLALAPWVSAVFIALWLLTLMYTTKFLDGLDGLVSGMLFIGSVVIFSLSLFTKYYQPEVAVLCSLLAGSALGFLIFNFHPAKIFLGEGGSTFAGFMLGVLAVISGGKIATAVLVLGIPLLDLVWVVSRRVFKEKKSPFKGDRSHLHFRLLDLGFSPRKAVLLLYALAAGFGFSTLFLQSMGKLVAMGILAGIMAVLGAGIMAAWGKRKRGVNK